MAPVSNIEKPASSTTEVSLEPGMNSDVVSALAPEPDPEPIHERVEGKLKCTCGKPYKTEYGLNKHLERYA